MKTVTSVFAFGITFFTLTSTAITVQPAQAAEYSLQGSASQYSLKAAESLDGNWTVTLTTPDFNYDSGIARGYTFQFDAQVENGIFHGERGRENQPGWLTMDGTIQADGTAKLRLFGIVGQSPYAIGHIKVGSTYGYLVTASFKGDHGTGSRVGGRPTDFTFEKKNNVSSDGN